MAAEHAAFISGTMSLKDGAFQIHQYLDMARVPADNMNRPAGSPDSMRYTSCMLTFGGIRKVDVLRPPSISQSHIKYFDLDIVYIYIIVKYMCMYIYTY